MPGTNGSAWLHAAGCPVTWIGAVLRPRWPRPWRALRLWRCNASAVAALEALDTRMLEDIGIERSEIQSVVCGLGRDASHVDRTETRLSKTICMKDSRMRETSMNL